MRGIPGLGSVVVAQAHAVMMTDLGVALAALRPVAAGLVVRARERTAVRLRAGEDVVHVGRIATAVHGRALLGQRGLLVQLVRAMQVRDVFRDDDSFRVLPRARADTIARVDGLRALRAEIGVPSVVPRPDCRGERLAELVGTREATEIRALSGAGAGDEEGHARLLGLRPAACAKREQRDGSELPEAEICHSGPPVVTGG